MLDGDVSRVLLRAGPSGFGFTPAKVLARVAEHGDLALGLLKPAPF